MMLERSYIWFVEEPARLTSFGRVSAMAGSLLLIFGAIGRVLMIPASLAPGAQVSRLADLGLPFPTFLLPESVLGVLVCGASIGLGLYAAHAGRSLERFMRGVR